MNISEKTLEKLYGAAAVSMQKERYAAAEKSFEDIYGKADNIRIFSAPGRTEVGGNHTDHNRGCVGCGRCLAKCPIHMNIVKVVKTLGGAEA